MTISSSETVISALTRTGSPYPSSVISVPYRPFGIGRIASSIASRERSTMWSASGSMLARSNSVIMSRNRSAPVSLQLTSDRRSPLASTGLRELAPRIASRSALSVPRSRSFMCGKRTPSSWIDLASAVNPRPPTSTRWQVEASSATGSRSRKAGETTTKSNRCPVPSHGSLVTNTSPGRIPATGNRTRKCSTARAIVFTCPGVPVTACAIMRPRRS